MNRFIIFILPGMLLLASGAKAEITYMNCKFNEGWHQKGTKREDWMQWHHEELIRDNKVFETVQLKLDI